MKIKKLKEDFYKAKDFDQSWCLVESAIKEILKDVYDNLVKRVYVKRGSSLSRNQLMDCINSLNKKRIYRLARQEFDIEL